jgi:hypothetical protein
MYLLFKSQILSIEDEFEDDFQDFGALDPLSPDLGGGMNTKSSGSPE